MKASAVLDMFSSYEIAREAMDKAEMERKQRDIENETRRPKSRGKR
jgi:hypothetical protein